MSNYTVISSHLYLCITSIHDYSGSSIGVTDVFNKWLTFFLYFSMSVTLRLGCAVLLSRLLWFDEIASFWIILNVVQNILEYSGQSTIQSFYHVWSIWLATMNTPCYYGCIQIAVQTFYATFWLCQAANTWRKAPSMPLTPYKSRLSNFPFTAKTSNILRTITQPHVDSYNAKPASINFTFIRANVHFHEFPPELHNTCIRNESVARRKKFRCFSDFRQL